MVPLIEDYSNLDHRAQDILRQSMVPLVESPCVANNGVSNGIVRSMAPVALVEISMALVEIFIKTALLLNPLSFVIYFILFHLFEHII